MRPPAGETSAKSHRLNQEENLLDVDDGLVVRGSCRPSGEERERTVKRNSTIVLAFLLEKNEKAW
jgi:hypothetical protein